MNFQQNYLIGNYALDQAEGQVSDYSNGAFLSLYDFFMKGIDTKKVEENGVKDECIKILNSVIKQIENIQKSDTMQSGGYDIKGTLEEKYGKGLEKQKEELQTVIGNFGATEEEKKDLGETMDNIEKAAEASELDNMEDRGEAIGEIDESEKKENDQIYHELASANSQSDSLDEAMGDAEAFLNKGEQVFNDSDLQNFSNKIYNILLTVGIIVAVIMGGILGLKLMTETGPEGKAEVKKLLVPYVAGCIIVFGGFAIWKIVVIVLSSI